MSTKSVTFGGVFTFPTNPKDKKDADAKSVKNRFNCGALRNSLKMMSSNGSTLIAVRLVRSKLRKREEHGGTVTTNHNNNVIQTSETTTVVVTAPPPPPPPAPAEPQLPPPFFWRYSNPASNNSSQYNMCNNDQTNLVHTLPCEEVSECKGFRKNLRGKWKRLVKKKPQQEVYTIPAELREQLKQIYVY